MRKLFKTLLSMKMVILLLFLFAIASGVATFIENDFGTEAAWAVVYTSWWFEAIQIALGILLIYNIYKYKMYKKSKLPAFVFHLGFIFILIGSGVTRYMGYEGILHIRNGNTANRMISSDSYVSVSALKNGKMYQVSLKKLISSVGNNKFNIKLNVAGNVADIKYKDFVPNAVTKLVKVPNGKPAITMLVSINGSPENITLKEGKFYIAGNNIIALDTPVGPTNKNIIEIKTKNKKFYLTSQKPISWFKMVANKRGKFEANKEYELTTGRLYTIGKVNIAPRQMLLSAKEKIVTETNPLFKGRKGMKLSALIVDVKYRGKTKEIAMFGMGKGTKGFTKKAIIVGTPFMFEWGSKIVKLPFAIKLIEFQLDRYPGSMSPMSYASEVEVIDKAKGVKMPFRIYMNHVLSYRGYRFFQSSYDRDGLGTILSVNKDPGKWPTYLGYFLLGLGLFLNLLNPKSRFRKLAHMVQRDMNKTKSILLAFFLAFSLLQTTSVNADGTFNFLKKYDKASAEKFGTILVQSADGRIMPIDTVSENFLNKVYRGSSYKGLTPNQVTLGMMASPKAWQTQKIIKVYHPTIKKIIGMKPNENYASFNQFFTTSKTSSGYKLTKYAEAASRKKPSARNKFDKDILKVDERVNICYMVYTGEIFKMIPKANDPTHKWYGLEQAIRTFPRNEVEEIRKILAKYFNGIQVGLTTGNWSKADVAIDAIKKYQEQYGSSIIPSPSRVKAEIFFNKAKIFQRLMPVYLLSGLILLLFIFAKMAKPSLNIRWITKIIFWINVVAFAVHTGGLGMRWFIAQHAPWSDGYESMIYIAWAIMLSGLIFSRQAIIALSLTSILAGVTLFVAHLSWMDPQMTTLVPVLNSYWLNIHVSVITASYGFLGLCTLLGFFTLLLFIVRKPGSTTRRAKELDRSIIEATRINEMAMILGLSLLTMGNFLGAVWANESWGRYWSWDPKETWALVSILIFAAIVHFRFIQKLSSPFSFAVASTLAYSSIIMTYFGVNYYLSGMHSYATGDPVPIPTFVYYTVAIVFIVIALAFRNRKMEKRL